MKNRQNTRAGGRGTLAAALHEAGVPAQRIDDLLAVLTQAIYDAQCAIPAGGGERVADFDPLTTLLENVDVRGIGRKLGLHEDLAATALVTVLSRLIARPDNRVDERPVLRESLAVRLLVRLLDKKFGRHRESAVRRKPAVSAASDVSRRETSGFHPGSVPPTSHYAGP